MILIQCLYVCDMVILWLLDSYENPLSNGVLNKSLASLFMEAKITDFLDSALKLHHNRGGNGIVRSHVYAVDTQTSTFINIPECCCNPRTLWQATRWNLHTRVAWDSEAHLVCWHGLRNNNKVVITKIRKRNCKRRRKCEVI